MSYDMFQINTDLEFGYIDIDQIQFAEGDDGLGINADSIPLLSQDVEALGFDVARFSVDPDVLRLDMSDCPIDAMKAADSYFAGNSPQPANLQPANPQPANLQPANPQMANPQMPNPQPANPPMPNPQPANPQPDPSKKEHFSVYMGPPEWKRDIIMQNIARVEQDIVILTHELENAIKDYDLAQKLFVKFGNNCEFLYTKLLQKQFKLDTIRYKLNNTFGIHNYMVMDLNQADGLHYLHKEGSL
jgi:hypothetical protein